VSLHVQAYNSKVYYIILQGANLGDAVYRFPLTGNDTVLDAVSQINGLQEISSKKIWVARATDECSKAEVLPVDWCAITEFGVSPTNYQLFPGDRVFVSEDRFVAFDNKLAKVLAPMERMMGFSLLTAGTATRLSGKVLKGGGNPRGVGSGF
jgi:polysaccharide export outer membrane protein